MGEIFYLYALKAYEEKLKEYMSESEYQEFATKVAKEGFKEELEGMEPSDFKDTILEHFDEITR